jgi:DNA (cytosine-5)-methyltransferase 1
MTTIGSLFSGIGGLELGLERAGLGPTIWQVEADPFCRSVLAKHWPNAARFDDVKTVGAAQLVRPEIICGGFPCQDISFAGKGAGLAGERSGLWVEYLRIITEIKPRFVVIENVPGLVRRGLADVVTGLDELGYSVVGTRIAAADVGAPHKRERIFLVAHTDRFKIRQQSWRGSRESRQDSSEPRHDGEARNVADSDCRRQLQQERTIGNERGWPGNGSCESSKSNVADSDCFAWHTRRYCVAFQSASRRDSRRSDQCGFVSDAHGARLEKRGEQPARQERHTVERSSPFGNAWTVEPDVGRVAHGVPARVARLKALGNAVVPQVAEVVGRLIVQMAGA